MFRKVNLNAKCQNFISFNTLIIYEYSYIVVSKQKSLLSFAAVTYILLKALVHLQFFRAIKLSNSCSSNFVLLKQFFVLLEQHKKLLELLWSYSFVPGNFLVLKGDWTSTDVEWWWWWWKCMELHEKNCTTWTSLVKCNTIALDHYFPSDVVSGLYCLFYCSTDKLLHAIEFYWSQISAILITHFVNCCMQGRSNIWNI